MKRFGKSAKKDFEKISEIILAEDLDVVAFQEIFSEGQGINKLFTDCVKYELNNWDLKFNIPHDSNDPQKMIDFETGESTRGEGYAYAWKKRKFKIVEFERLGIKRLFEPRIVNSLSNDVSIDCGFFARAPYFIRLQPIYGGFFELRLINIHIHYGNAALTEIEKRKLEYDALVQKIYPELCQKRYGNNRTAYTIAMGDYNLNIFSPLVQTAYRNCYLSPAFNYSDSTENYSVLTIQENLSTLGGRQNGESNEYQLSNNFDHFSYSPELGGLTSIHCNVINAIEKYCDGDADYYLKNISDHLPIVAEIEV